MMKKIKSFLKKHCRFCIAGSIALLLLLTVGIIFLWHGGKLSQNIPEKNDEYVVSIIDGNVQRVKTEIDNYYYPPIQVTAGIPVEWTITADNNHFNECNHAILIPDFGLKVDLKVGETVIKFTPTKSGEYDYTCWMNMIKSKIRVVEPDWKKGQNITIGTGHTTVLTDTSSTDSCCCDASSTTPNSTNEKSSSASNNIPDIKNGSSSASTNAENTVTLTGYLIDEDCFTSPGYKDPSKESSGCLLMPTCASSGYGIAVKNDDGSYKFYYFDGQISGLTQLGYRIDNATGGQKLAWDYIDKNTNLAYFRITVTGVLTGEKRENPNPDTADGIKYEVVKVVELT